MSYFIILQPNLLACRLCLATDVKLFDIREKKLAEAYSHLLGVLATPITPLDGLPQHVCTSCGVLLLKFTEFRQRGLKALMILNNAMLQQDGVTTEYLRHIDRKSLNLSLPLKQTYIQNIQIDENIANTVVIKQETTSNADECQIVVKHETELSVDPLSCNIDTSDTLNNINKIKEGNSKLNNPNKIHDHLGKETYNIKKSKINDTNIYNDLFSLIESDISDDNNDSQEDSDDQTLITLKNRKRKKNRKKYVDKAPKMNTNISKPVDDANDFGNADIKIESDVSSNCTNDNSDFEAPNKFETLDLNTEVSNSNNGVKCHKDNIYINDSNLHLQNKKRKKDKNTNVTIKKLPVKKRSRPNQISNILKRINNCMETMKEIKVKQDNIKKKAEKQEVLQRQRARKKLNLEEIEQFENANCVDIRILTKEEQIAEIEARKNSDSYISSPYKCELCYKGCVSAETLKNHMVKHDPSRGNVECEVCRTRFRTQHRMRGHVFLNHEMRITCRECQFLSRCYSKAREHYMFHKGYQHECQYCGKTFSKRSSHLGHVRLQHPAEMTSCEICGELFVGPKGVLYHMRIAHRELQNPAHKCASCKVQFHSAEALGKHADASSLGGGCDGNVRPCPECGDNFLDEESLKEHRQSAHGHEHKCELCERVFANEIAYNIHHERVHLHVRSKQYVYKRHKHRDRQSVVCEICGSKKQSDAALRYHQRVHTGERPYQCTLCPKRFAMPLTLKVHMRRHTDVRPYKCAQCPLAFHDQSNFNRHLKGHSGEKPYTCNLCGKSFTQHHSVKVHIKTVHMKIPAPPRRRRPQPGKSKRGTEGY